jgi:hypothetical protein
MVGFVNYYYIRKSTVRVFKMIVIGTFNFPGFVVGRSRLPNQTLSSNLAVARAENDLPSKFRIIRRSRYLLFYSATFGPPKLNIYVVRHAEYLWHAFNYFAEFHAGWQHFTPFPSLAPALAEAAVLPDSGVYCCLLKSGEKHILKAAISL